LFTVDLTESDKQIENDQKHADVSGEASDMQIENDQKHADVSGEATLSTWDVFMFLVDLRSDWNFKVSLMFSFIFPIVDTISDILLAIH